MKRKSESEKIADKKLFWRDDVVMYGWASVTRVVCEWRSQEEKD